jgi:hypothetical protein
MDLLVKEMLLIKCLRLECVIYLCGIDSVSNALYRNVKGLIISIMSSQLRRLTCEVLIS